MLFFVKNDVSVAPFLFGTIQRKIRKKEQIFIIPRMKKTDRIDSRGNMSMGDILCVMMDKVYGGEAYPLEKLLDDFVINFGIQRIMIHVGKYFGKQTIIVEIRTVPRCSFYGLEAQDCRIPILIRKLYLNQRTDAQFPQQPIGIRKAFCY